MEWLEPGYAALFFLSFAAATLVPLGSEWLLVVMLSQGFSPLYSLLFATAGNTLGSYVNYALGYWAHDWLQQRNKLSGAGWLRAEQWFEKYGVWSLLMAWVPVVGDPLTFIAGILKASWKKVWWLILLSKLGRYLVLVGIFLFFSPGS
ncbi:YqaA family protein [Bacterioplanoides sp.]|uniref:YqaA family protein n=1 Tax=Bacterioplanoides sp. TaxID=2066072 RepID=UPI003B5A7BA9